MSTHDVKIITMWFDRVAAGEKTAEVRFHDRDYQAGDLLVMREVDDSGVSVCRWNPPGRDDRGRFTPSHWSQRRILARITHVLPASMAHGLSPSYCLLSFRVEGVSKA